MSSEPRLLSTAVPAERDGRTIKSLLKSEFHMAEGYIAALKLRPDGIRLDGERVHTNVRACAWQLLTVRVDDAGEENPAVPIPVPLVVLFEDADLAVIEKPAGMVVHGADPDGAPTLANALAARWGREQSFHPVHRLDRGTSGLLLVARSRYVSELLRRKLHTEGFVREYLALAEGRLNPEEGEIALPLGPAEGERFRQCVRSDGRAALTRYETLGAFAGGSLLRLRLETGRTHQIRVHLAALGHPLLGDAFYGASRGLELGRPALHAARLQLYHPVTGEKLCLESALPDDLQRFLDKTGN